MPGPGVLRLEIATNTEWGYVPLEPPSRERRVVNTLLHNSACSPPRGEGDRGAQHIRQGEERVQKALHGRS